MRIVVSDIGPYAPDYPGPHDSIPQKYPWKQYPPPTRKGPTFSEDELEKYNLR